MTTPHTSGAADLPEALDAIADSQYLAGVTAGWNAAQANDPNAALRKIHESRAGYLKPLRDAQLAALAAGQAAPHQWDTGYPPLPDPGINTASHAHFRVIGYTEAQMCAYVDADRAARPAPPAMDGTWKDNNTAQLVNELRGIAVEFHGAQQLRECIAHVVVPLTCEWTHNNDDGCWETACGEAWRFDDGGPAENNMKFCHSCGKSLLIKGGQHGNE